MFFDFRIGAVISSSISSSLGCWSSLSLPHLAFSFGTGSIDIAIVFSHTTRMQIRHIALAVFTSSFSTMSVALNSEATIRKILTNSKTIALVGASPKPERPSNYVMKFLLDHNYDVIPINPGLEGQELYGKKVLASLSSIPKTVEIDMVDIFRNSAAVPPIVDEAIQVGAKSIWMQMGVINEEAAEKARNAGLDVVQDTCPKVRKSPVAPWYAAESFLGTHFADLLDPLSCDILQVQIPLLGISGPRVSSEF